MPIPDFVYNWLVEYFEDRCHVTKVGNSVSTRKTINASIVQGSVIGPVSYILNLEDQRPCNDGNEFVKYADDGDLIVPAVNTHTIPSEIENINKWSKSNNLKLNVSKSKEMIVYKQSTNNAAIQSSGPPSIPGVERVTSMNVLGVIIDDKLSFKPHLEQRVMRNVASSIYALKVLRSKGLEGQRLWDVTRQTLMTRMLYASPVWWGFVDDRASRESAGGGCSKA